jgi:acyl transferase domain-containing protein
MNLTTYLRAGYPGLALITSEEARAEAEVSAACTSLKRRLHAWSSTEGLVDTKEGRVTACTDPLDALQLLEGMFAAGVRRFVECGPKPTLVNMVKRIALAKGETRSGFISRMALEGHQATT